MKRALLLLFIFLLPSLASADELALPQILEARATVIRSDRDGFWEKTLIVRFPQRRRVLSTNDGLIDVMAAANHSAHPLLWSRVDETMKTDHEAGGQFYMRKIRERTARIYGLRGEDISLMGTAADMDNLAVVTKTFAPFTVTALVTAGAKGNAIRTGVDRECISKLIPPRIVPQLRKSQNRGRSTS